MRILQVLHSVDGVVAFDDDTTTNMLLNIRPDVYVRCGDYEPDQMAESVLGSLSAEIVVVPRNRVISTTSLTGAK
jgi:bifunctional ADP-heptose synthase (sugar kinase/adenylyltransferase)